MPLEHSMHSRRQRRCMSQHRNHFTRLSCSLIFLFDLCWAALPAHIPLRIAPNTTPNILAVNTHFASRSAQLRDIPAHVTSARALQTSWVREDFHWYRIQRTADAYDWSFPDATVDAFEAQGINVLGVLGHPPGWATRNPQDDPYNNSFAAPDPDLFAAWAAQTVARYRHRVTYWQIWNEPDNPHFWYPAPDPVAYAKLVHITARAIARVAPEVKIVAAGINPFALQFLNDAAAVGLWNDVDILAIHPYVNPLDPRYSGLAEAALSLTPLLHRYGHKPIWITEIGWASATSDRDPPGVMTEQLQAEYLSRAIQILWQSDISHVFWYSWKDEKTNPYGLFRWATGPDDMSQPKPAAAVFRTLQSVTHIRPHTQTFHPVLTFDGMHDIWVRGDEHTGVLYASQRRAVNGGNSIAIRYAFPAYGNQYLVFRRWHHAPFPMGTTQICLTVWGDDTSTLVKIWLRGSDTKRMQLTLGLSGPAGWRDLCAPIPQRFAPWDRIDPSDGYLHQPATFEALVLDDAPDGVGSRGTIYFDALRATTD